jgi:hypothetical protein
MLEKPPLVSPPRSVPGSLRFCVLLGGVLPTIAFAVLTFGGFMAMIFITNSELATSLAFAPELATTDGIVLQSEATNSRINSERVVRVTYRYSVNAQEHVGKSFCQGKPPATDSQVLIEYDANDPAISRIAGMRTRPFPKEIGLLLILPFAAILLLGFAYLRGKRRVRLMQYGKSAWGLLTNKRPTSTRINSQRVYELEFTFLDDDGQKRQATGRSHKSTFFDDEVARHVLWDPETRQNCIVELLPGRPQIADQQWQPASTLRVLVALILPAAAGIATYAATFIRF